MLRPDRESVSAWEGKRQKGGVSADFGAGRLARLVFAGAGFVGAGVVGLDR